MSKADEKLKKLEGKIDRLSEQLRATEERIEAFLKGLLAVSSDLVETLDKSRKQDEEQKRRHEHRTYYRGLIMGLILGIMGNYLVSFYVEFIKGVGMPFWGWALGAIISLFGIWFLIRMLERASRK